MARRTVTYKLQVSVTGDLSATASDAVLEESILDLREVLLDNSGELVGFSLDLEPMDDISEAQ